MLSILLAEFFIKLFTEEGDNVLDPFGGSGTTALAGLRLDRNTVLIDNKPEYVEVAKGRIEKMQVELGFQYKLW